MFDELRNDIAHAVEKQLSIGERSDCSATFATAESCSVRNEVLVGSLSSPFFGLSLGDGIASDQEDSRHSSA